VSLAVHFRVLPCGIVLVLGSLQVMTEGNPGMVCGPLVVASLVKPGSLAMMFGCLFIVLRCVFVVLVNLVVCHSILLEIREPQDYLSPDGVSIGAREYQRGR
jgi:hypothetical protein